MCNDFLNKTMEVMLHGLITTPDEDDVSFVEEYGWISDDEFCVWVPYMWLDNFIDELKKIFGCGLFDDGGITANMQQDCICIDLCEFLGGYLDIETVFPKEKYQH